MTEREFFKMVARAWSRWDVIGPLEDDAAEDVEQLAALGCVDIIIPRQAKTVENVKRSLRRHGINYRTFRWVPLKSCKSLFRYDVYMDDSPRLAERLAGRDGLLLLYDQPWNRKAPNVGNIVRVASLDEA